MPLCPVVTRTILSSKRERGLVLRQHVSTTPSSAVGLGVRCATLVASPPPPLHGHTPKTPFRILVPGVVWAVECGPHALLTLAHWGCGSLCFG